ncbi:hypothetical protein ASD48_40095 [Streptomyces sp. Root1310]|nr:hypothetical protein ASD48_40095 [Streptomyces sp. Root1310]
MPQYGRVPPELSADRPDDDRDCEAPPAVARAMSAPVSIWARQERVCSILDLCKGRLYRLLQPEQTAPSAAD